MNKIIKSLTKAKPAEKSWLDWHTQNTAAQIGLETVRDLYLNDKEGFKKARDKGKAVGLAFCYGGTWFMVKRAYPGLTDREAQTIEKSFFSSLPVFKKYLDTLLKKAEQTLSVETFIGRHIPVQGLNSTEWFLKNEAKNGVYNYPIQGGGGELVRLILIDVADWVEENRLYALQGNLICDTFATRIVAVLESDAYDIKEHYGLSFEDILNQAPDGNLLILVTDEQGNIKAEFDRPVKIDMETLLYFNAKVVF